MVARGATAALQSRVDHLIVSRHPNDARVSPTYDIYSHVILDLDKEVVLRKEAKLLGR